MTAQLNPGIRSLHLVIPTPYDLIRTTDVRDDLVAVKVWYSETSGFDPQAGQGTLFSEANSLSVTITGLETNKVYYVKYALISSIDPTTYTVSQQYSAMTFDENTSVYGYLTNDPTALSTASDGSGGNWAVTSGVFKVYSFSEDVTGKHDLVNGPFYSVKANSNIGGLVATIDPITGAYSASAMTGNSGSVIFRAVYKNLVVEKVWNVYKGIAGQTAPTIQLTTNTKEFVYKDVNQKRSETNSATITANLKNLTGTVHWGTRAYSRSGQELGAQFGDQQIAYTTASDGLSITISNDQFSNPLDYNVDLGYVVVTASIGTVFDSMSIYRINDGSTQIQVEQTNQTHTITAAEDGGTDPLNYVGSGTTITVKRGAQALLIDNNSPYAADTWRIVNIVSHNITCDTTPNAQDGSSFAEFDKHSAMTEDAAYIDYTVRVQITGSNEGNSYQEFTTRQSFSKSKQGVQGNTAHAVTLTWDAQHFFTPQNSTTAINPNTGTNYITALATASNYSGRATYTWTVNGVAPTPQVGEATGNSFKLYTFPSGTTSLVKVVVSEDAYSSFDQGTVFSLKEGSDAIAAGFLNENKFLVCDSLGNPEQGQLPFTTTLNVVQGATVITTTGRVLFEKVSYSGGNASSYSITQNGIITINSLNTDFAEAVFRVTVGDVVLLKTLYIGKVKDGKTPVKGVDYNDGTSIKVQYSQNASSWHDTYINGDVFIRVGTVAADGSTTTWSAAQKYIPEKGIEYNDGKSAYLHIKYSDDNGATFTDNNGEYPGIYMGTYTDDNPLDSNNKSLYTWIKIKGDDGPKGPRNASGFLYYQVSATSPPAAPNTDFSSWSWSSGTFTTPGTNWSHSLFTPNAGEKAYAIRYYVSESAYGVTPVTVTFGSVVTSITFDGLVTFTDLSAKADTSALNNKVSTGGAANDVNNYRNTTQILGGAIKTGTLNADRLTIGDNSDNAGDGLGKIVISSNLNNIKVYSNVNGNMVPRVIIGNLAA